jgi:hypothetical protein
VLSDLKRVAVLLVACALVAVVWRLIAYLLGPCNPHDLTGCGASGVALLFLGFLLAVVVFVIVCAVVFVVVDEWWRGRRDAE